MEEGADQTEVDLLEHVKFWIATILVAYSRGNADTPNVKPYGLKASRSTPAFKKLPSQHLAITFAALYQCVRTEPDHVDRWVKSVRPNITAPWPRGMVRRFVKSQSVFIRERNSIFEAYEQNDGKYHGDEESAPLTDNKKRKRVEDTAITEEDFE